MIQVEDRPALGWSHCVYLSNGHLELIVTAEVGPRILHAGLPGGDNHLGVNPAAQGLTGGEEWRPYGGHRLWHAPEAYPRTYAPDNAPVSVERYDDGARFTQAIEPATGIQKELELRLSPEAAHVQVIHRLRNHGLWALELAPWALSVMAPGGTAVLPLLPRTSHSLETLLPTGQLTLWPYTDLADPRWTWGTRYLLARHDPARSSAQKIGVRGSVGWLAYARAGELFVKTFTLEPGARYPDADTPVEIYLDGALIELETLAPLRRLAPGATVEHIEHWHLARGVVSPANDAEVEARLLPLVRALAR